MRLRAQLAVVAVVVLALSSSGCLTVYPLRSFLSTDPRAASLPYENHIAYERKENPTVTGECPSGAETRGILVPQRSQWVNIYVLAKITPAPGVAQPVDPRHFDFTVVDGNNTVWMEIHFKNSDVEKRLTIEGPRPGGWTVTLSYAICELDFPPLKVDDQFDVLITVRQPD